MVSTRMEAETMAPLTMREHVDGEEKRSKHRALRHPMVNWDTGGARVS